MFKSWRGLSKLPEKCHSNIPELFSHHLHLEHPHPGLVIHFKRLVKVDIQGIQRKKQACIFFRSFEFQFCTVAVKELKVENTKYSRVDFKSG